MKSNCNCLRCGVPMKHVFTEYIQLGKTSWLAGDWSNLIAGAMLVDVYRCPQCGKLELFSAEDHEHSQSDIPQVVCPNCGQSHDFDYPSCPFCKHTY